MGQQSVRPGKLRGEDRQPHDDDHDAWPGQNQHEHAGQQDGRAHEEHDAASHAGWKRRKPSTESVSHDHHLHAEFRIEVLPRVRLAAAPDARRRADGDPAEATPLYVGVTIADALARASRCPPRSLAKLSRLPARPFRAPSPGSLARSAATPPSVVSLSRRIFHAASRCGKTKKAGRTISKAGPAVRPGNCGPTGSEVSTGPRLRITQFIKCLTVFASVSSS